MDQRREATVGGESDTSNMCSEVEMIPKPHVPQYAKILHENYRLKAVIADAPHEVYPDGTACPAAYGEYDAVCSCWKADALG